MAALGHPLVADARYGGGYRLELRPDRGGADIVLDRYALHAARLSFRHPADGRTVRVEAALPEDLSIVVEALRGGGVETVGGMELRKV